MKETGTEMGAQEAKCLMLRSAHPRESVPRTLMLYFETDSPRGWRDLSFLKGERN